MKRQILFVAVLTLTLFLQACGGASATPVGGDGAAGPPPSGGGGPGGPETGGGLLGGPGPDSLDLSNASNFSEIPNNYLITMDFRFESTQADGTPVSSSWRLD